MGNFSPRSAAVPLTTASAAELIVFFSSQKWYHLAERGSRRIKDGQAMDGQRLWNGLASSPKQPRPLPHKTPSLSSSFCRKIHSSALWNHNTSPSPPGISRRFPGHTWGVPRSPLSGPSSLLLMAVPIIGFLTLTGNTAVLCSLTSRHCHSRPSARTLAFIS